MSWPSCALRRECRMSNSGLMNDLASAVCPSIESVSHKSPNDLNEAKRLNGWNEWNPQASLGLRVVDVNIVRRSTTRGEYGLRCASSGHRFWLSTLFLGMVV